MVLNINFASILNESDAGKLTTLAVALAPLCIQ